MRRRRKYSAGEAARRKHSWLELVQQSGPFLTLPVVDRVFPDGLPEVQSTVRSGTRTGIADMLDDGGATRRRVIESVLVDALDWAGHLRQGHDLPAALTEPVPEYGTRIVPDFGFYVSDAEEVSSDFADDDGNDGDEDGDVESTDVVEDVGPWQLLGAIVAWGDHPLTRTTENGWTASPVERLAHLLRARGVPIGLVTDGRWWSLVWAPIGGTTGAAVWDAGLWSEEPESFQAFVALLTRARFMAVAKDDTLPSLFVESLAAQEEVTETLGRQVRDAVELLIATLDRLDAESGDRILAGVSDDELYDGVVTVMMRIVFLLFAEERRLLPSDDHLYVAGYSVSRLVEQLEEQAALAGEQTLEYRTGAWHRLLAVARALHSGVAHEDLRLPAYGGGLFDPDRYPWLEGRTADDGNSAAVPPAVDDRTVLRMLRAVQYVDINGERRRLTFRALDVEQIGYVYEGLLELEVRTATEVVLGFVRPAKWPKGKKEDVCEVPLSEVSTWLAEPPAQLAQRLKARTGWTASKVEQALQRILDAHDRTRILSAVGGDIQTADEILTVAAVLRSDERGQPAITMPGRRYIGPSARRAATGTHYTPRSLAEDVVNNTLEPLVYRPGPLQTADRESWQIRASSEILELRVADIAMGSGAFLVAACRYLADRLLEAWIAEGKQSAILAERRRERGTMDNDAEVEQVGLDARRLVAEHCLYGVDINPLAVEMAKLSLWLVTMDRERPFGFLDDRLVCGDALLGLASLGQLETLHLDPATGRGLTEGMLDYAAGWREVLVRSAVLRRRITSQPVVSIRDVEHKQRLLAEARELADSLKTIADAITGLGLRSAKQAPKESRTAFIALQLEVGGDPTMLTERAERDLQSARPIGTAERRPLHWPLAFPEVFVDSGSIGFDAIIGNPPFSGGQKQSATMGVDYLDWLQRWDGRGIKGSADLAARFVLRAERLLSPLGQLGFIATNTLVQGDTLEVGLLQATERGLTIRRGRSSHPWPSSSASLEIVDIWASRAPLGAKAQRWLDGEEVPSIGPDLEPVGRISGRPYRLSENDGLAFVGAYVLGLGFAITADVAQQLAAADKRNADVLEPFVIGKDLNQRPDSSASRWIINFRDWPLDRAEDYSAPMDIVRRLVKPERDKQRDKQRREIWWRFTRPAPDLYDAISKLDYVLALSLHGSVVVPVRVPAGQVFSHGCAVFALEDYADLAFLSSNANVCWVLRYASTLETRIRYAPSDVFLTLPRPLATAEMEALGRRLDVARRELMLSRGWGLTTTYNHIHRSSERDAEVQHLRDIHAEIDHAVLRAYGWDDLDPQIGHHSSKLGVRWTVSREARFELLDRLLEENHRRYEAQQ